MDFVGTEAWSRREAGTTLEHPASKVAVEPLTLDLSSQPEGTYPILV